MRAVSNPIPTKPQMKQTQPPHHEAGGTKAKLIFQGRAATNMRKPTVLLVSGIMASLNCSK